MIRNNASLTSLILPAPCMRSSAHQPTTNPPAHRSQQTSTRPPATPGRPPASPGPTLPPPLVRPSVGGRRPGSGRLDGRCRSCTVLLDVQGHPPLVAVCRPHCIQEPLHLGLMAR